MKKTNALYAMVTTFILLAATSVARAAELPKMPETVSVVGRPLQLNGTGLRTATIFKVKVYEAGLYLPQRSNNPQQIINSPEPKVVRLNFLRDVSQKQVQEAWKEGFEKNCETACDQLKPTFDQFVSALPGAKKGDVFVYAFTPKGLVVLQNEKQLEQINNPQLGKVVISTWLGKEPPSKDLKQAMLGLSREGVS